MNHEDIIKEIFALNGNREAYAIPFYNYDMPDIYSRDCTHTSINCYRMYEKSEPVYYPDEDIVKYDYDYGDTYHILLRKESGRELPVEITKGNDEKYEVEISHDGFVQDICDFILDNADETMRDVFLAVEEEMSPYLKREGTELNHFIRGSSKLGSAYRVCSVLSDGNCRAEVIATTENSGKIEVSMNYSYL